MISGTRIVLYIVPIYTLFLIAIIYAVMKWRRHPRLSAMVVTALVIDMFREWSYLFFILPDSSAQLLTYSFLSVVYELLMMATWGLLLLAAFLGFHDGAKSRDAELTRKAVASNDEATKE